MKKVVGFAHTRHGKDRGPCPHPHKKLFEKSFFGIFKNFPQGKFCEVDYIANRALLPCEALFFVAFGNRPHRTAESI